MSVRDAPRRRPAGGRASGAVLLLLPTALLARPAAGQLPAAGAAHLATAESGTVLARGYAAPGLNPANLALSGNPSLSISLLPLRIDRGMGPVGLGDLAEHQDRALSRSVKEAWLGRVEAAGRQVGGATVELSGVALSIGSVGVQLSSVASARAALNPDAAELLLFGNVGRTGSPREFVLEGSSVDAFAATTLGVSVGRPVEAEWLRSGERLTVGVTLTYTVGHGLLVGRDAGSTVSDEPVDVRIRFPVVESGGEAGGPGAGSGVGMDLGLAWERGPWTLEWVARNLVQTFRWNDDALRFRAGDALLGGGEDRSDFEPRPLREAPASLRERALARPFHRTLGVAAAYRATARLTLTGELRHRAGEGPSAEGRTHVGAGVELRLRPGLPLRAGASLVGGDPQLAGGVAVRLAGMTVDAAAGLHLDEARRATLAQLTVSYRRR